MEQKLIIIGDTLICPNCKASLKPIDVEGHLKCPFCDFNFAQYPEIEDFITATAIDKWLHQQSFPM